MRFSWEAADCATLAEGLRHLAQDARDDDVTVLILHRR